MVQRYSLQVFDRNMTWKSLSQFAKPQLISQCVESVGSCGGISGGVESLSMFLFSHKTRLLSKPITAMGMTLWITFHASKPSRILV